MAAFGKYMLQDGDWIKHAKPLVWAILALFHPLTQYKPNFALNEDNLFICSNLTLNWANTGSSIFRLSHTFRWYGWLLPTNANIINLFWFSTHSTNTLWDCFDMTDFIGAWTGSWHWIQKAGWKIHTSRKHWTRWAPVMTNSHQPNLNVNPAVGQL